MADNKVNSGLLEFSEDQKVFVALDAETSEVKKAVTIDGDGVETDIQGVQPTGKKEITSTAEVNVASYATAQVVDEDLVAGNIKKDVDILGVVGSYEPEAPASDFSIATITATLDNDVSNVKIAASGAVEAVEPEPAHSAGYIFFDETHTTAQVILYKGKAWISVPVNCGLSNLSENIVSNGGLNNTYTINGDCSFTVVPATH